MKFISDNDLTLQKSLELNSIVIVLRSVFIEDNKYYLKLFLDDCLLNLPG